MKKTIGIIVIGLIFIGSAFASPKAKYKLDSIGEKEFLHFSNMQAKSSIFKHDDKTVLLQNDAFIKKDGKKLIFKGRIGGHITFESANDSAIQGDEFYFLGEYPQANSYLVGYLIASENFITILVNKNTCDTSSIDDFPYISPNGKFVFCIKNFEMQFCNFTIYKLSGQKLIVNASGEFKSSSYPESVFWIDNTTLFIKMKEMDNEFDNKFYYFKLTIL